MSIKTLQRLETNFIELNDSKQKLDPKKITIPTILKDVTLLSPGNWNGLKFSADEIRNAFQLTDWHDKKNYELIKDHADKPLSVNDWVGYVRNIRLSSDGSLVGDLELWDEQMIIKLVHAKAKFGISAKVLGMEMDGEFRNFTFANFSIVDNPACKEAYVNLSENKELKEIRVYHTFNGEIELSNNSERLMKGGVSQEMAKVTNFEEIRKKKGMSVSEFYAIPRDPPSSSKLPIFDAAHVRNALARINQVKGVSSAERKTAMRKIRAAAKKFGIKVSKEMESQNSNLKQTERRSEKMAKETKAKAESLQEEPEPEEAEEESVEEENEVSEDAANEDTEELSSKLDKILSSIETLSKRIKKLEESEEEPESEPESEKESEEESEESNEPEEAEEESSEELKEEKKLSEEPNSLSVQELADIGGRPGRHSDGTLEMSAILRKNLQ